MALPIQPMKAMAGAPKYSPVRVSASTGPAVACLISSRAAAQSSLPPY
jgi:hypothetical protein